MKTEPLFFTHKPAVRRAFERAAKTYDLAAALQQEIGRRMGSRLDYINHQPQAILDAGSGTGFAARALRKTYPKAHCIELDFALPMLQTSRNNQKTWQQRLRLHPLPSLVCADIEHLPLASNSIDMVWSNLTLQWCNQPDAAFAEFNRVLKPNGLLMFSTFGPDTLKELKHAFAQIDTHHHVNQFIDMHDLGDALLHHGFSTPVMDMEYLTLTYTDLKPLMQELKAMGAHNVTQGRPPGLVGKLAWQKLLAHYEQFRREGRLPATYEVIYGHAWKPETSTDRKRSDGSHIIEFHR